MDIDQRWLRNLYKYLKKQLLPLLAIISVLLGAPLLAFKNFRTYRFSLLVNINEIICAIIVSLVKHFHVKQQEPTISIPWRSSNGGGYYSEREIPLCSSLDVFHRMRSILFWNLGSIRFYRIKRGNWTIPILK